MASYAHSTEDVSSLIRYVGSSLIVRQLQAVLKAEGHAISGLKAPLQKRLIAHIESLKARNDVDGIRRVRQLVYHPDSSTSPAKSVASPSQPANGYTSSSTSARITQPVLSPSSYSSSSPSGLPRIHFRESPFYTVLAPLSSVEKCPVMSANRHQVKATVVLNYAQVQQIGTDKSYRCMVYCAALDSTTGFTRDTDISFPHSVELRVNDTQVSGLNLRGLKNKPGSTRPADITDHLSKKPNYRNEVGLTYALTQKNFAFVINLVRTETAENLVERLRGGKSIAKETVIADMIRKNEDSELVATSTIMSLKCPLSTLRIKLPTRSTFCSHMQCFDALSFLQLQQQAPTWSCPTCNKSISFNALVVDRYFEDILKSTPNTVQSVTIDADGHWSVAAEASNSPMPESSDEDDKEIVEISASQNTIVVNGKDTPVATPPAIHTLSDMPSSISRIGSTSNKRPASQVIDLTLSDDDEPPRPVKRTNALATPSSINSDVRANGYLSLDLSSAPGFTSASHSPIRTPDPFYSKGRNTYRDTRT